MLISLLLLGFLFSYSVCSPICGTVSFSHNLFLYTQADEKIRISFIREGGILSTTTVMFNVQGYSQSVENITNDYELIILPNADYAIYEIDRLVNITDFTREDVLFNLTIISATSDNYECDIGTISTSDLLIRSYGENEIVSNTTSTQFYGVTNETQGWCVNGNNGDESLFVDSHGFFMWDKVTGVEDNFKENPVMYILLLLLNRKSPDFGYFRLTDVDSYILTTDFEIDTKILSMTMWIKCNAEEVNEEAVIISMSSSNIISNEFTLYNPYSLSIIMNNTNIGLNTNINIVDNQWHHIGISWRSGDGKALFYIDGREVYTGGPYRSNYILNTPVSLIIGSGQNGKCEFVFCDTFGQFVGEIEDFKLFKLSLSMNDIITDMKYNYPFSNTNNRNEIYLFYRAQLQDVSSDMIFDVSTKEELENGQRADIEIEKIRPVNSTLKENIWYFRANEEFVGNKTEYYKGYLQFKMLRGKAYGSPRNGDRFIILEGGINNANGLPFRFSYKSEITELTANWTYFSIPLWETDRWINEITGQVTTEEDWRMLLNDLEKVLIRGDFYDYSSKGNGNEVVYINNIIIRNK